MTNYSPEPSSLHRLLAALGWPKSLPDKEFGSYIVTAKHLGSKLTKVRRRQQSLQKLHNDLLRDLDLWADLLDDDGSKMVVKQAANLFKTQASACQFFRDYEDGITDALGVVADKEKSIKQLHHTRRNLKSLLRHTAANFGDKSYNAQALAEQLETNSANLQVSESHYHKAINGKLKEALYHYSLGMRSVGGNYEIVGGNFEQSVGEKVYEESLEENKHCAKCSIEHGKPMGCVRDHGKKNATDIGLNVYEGW